jgi:hypothetical protein
MRRNLIFSKHTCEKLEKEYLFTLKTAHGVYQDKLFRLPKEHNTDYELSGRRSVPLADVVLLSIHKHLDEHEKLIKNRERIVEETRKVLSDPDNRLAIVGRLGVSKTAIERRINIFDELMRRSLI